MLNVIVLPDIVNWSVLRNRFPSTYTLTSPKASFIDDVTRVLPVVLSLPEQSAPVNCSVVIAGKDDLSRTI